MAAPAGTATATWTLLKLQVVEEALNRRADVSLRVIDGRLPGGDERPPFACPAKSDRPHKGRPDIQTDIRPVPDNKRHGGRVLRQGSCHDCGRAAGGNFAKKAGMFDNSAIETYHLRLPLFESGRKGEHG